MAPTPKPEGKRQRRNLGQKSWTTLERGSVSPPPMPGATTIEDPSMRRTASAYWKALWSDLGQIYTDADRFALARICILHAQAMHGRLGAQLQTELRQLEQSFGGSPIGRMRLMVQVRDAEDVEETQGPKVASMDAARQRKARLAAQKGPIE